MRKYLITGGAGFIGSNFVKYLFAHEEDIQVTVLDKLTYSGNMDNLKDVSHRPDFRFVQGDICDAEVVSRLISAANVVVNFAAEVAVDRSINNKKNFLMTDVIGVHVLLEGALNNKNNLERFIQISTDEVYGQILDGSFTENSPLMPRNPYAASKLGGDRLAYSYHVTYDLPVIITRSSNNYGPWAYPEKVIPLWVTNLMEGRNIPLYGQGMQVRDWLYVEDHCSAIHLLTKSGTNGEVYNIGAGQETSNLDLARSILQLMGEAESKIMHVQDRPGHDFRYSLATDKIRELGWEPQYSLKEGLEKTVNWYIANAPYWEHLKAGMEKRYLDGYWGV